MSTASPDKPSFYSHSPTPALSDVELETAVLRSVVETRPVGQHKHILMIQLQAELQRRTGVWLPSVDLWDRIGEIFDIPRLESLIEDPSLPGSPEALSPLPRRKPHRRDSASLSPLSTGPRSPSPSKKPSKSAQCINSGHFRTTFNLPYLRLGEEEWKPLLYDPEHMTREASMQARRRSRSVASSSTRPATDDGALLGEAEPDLSDDEYGWWSETLRDRARKEDGDAAQDDEVKFEAGVTKQLEEGDKAREKEEQEQEKAKGAKKKVGRPSKGAKAAAAAAAAAREASSELSDEAEEDEEAPKTGRGRRAAVNASNKRKRDSVAKEESEEEKDTKETKTRRRKR